MNFPAELRYTHDHEWIRVEGKHGFVGITDFAQSELGDIVFVDVTTLGKSLNAGDVFGSIDAVKTVSDLFIPVAGKVLAFNDGLNNKPETINQDPYGEGWLIKIELANPADVDGLLTDEAYRQLINQ
jgi:glycine cleavage system H protein